MSQSNFSTIDLELLADVAGGAGPTPAPAQGGPIFRSNGMTGQQASEYNRSMYITKDIGKILKAPNPSLVITPGGVIIGTTPYAGPPVR